MHTFQILSCVLFFVKQYLDAGLKTQNGEKLSLDLILPKYQKFGKCGGSILFICFDKALLK